MSDCADGGRNVYQRPHQTLRMRMEFVGDNQPWMYALALNGREVDGLYLDGVKYVPERTCEMEHIKGGAMYDVWRCSACGYEYAESVAETSIVQGYCPNCGAKIS